jgi:hypothetical protein
MDIGESRGSDVVGISSRDDTQTDHTEVFRLGTRALAPEPKPILADGGADGRWWPGDDDAKLWGNINSILPWEFMDRTANPQAIFMPWGGTNVGES